MFSFLNIFKKRKKITGLVLSGGGSRGFYHVGVLKALQELNIKIDRVAGTSIGAILGAMYASNPEIDFDEIVRELDFIKIFKMILSHLDNTSKSKLEELFKQYIKEDFKDLKIPLLFNAVDINKGKEIIFEKGKIFPWIFATMSIPGIFKPLNHDGKYLVDGAVINNVPVQYIEKYCDKLIISDISTTRNVDDKTSNLDVLKAVIEVAQKNNALEDILELKSMKNKESIVLKLKDEKTHFLDFRKKNYYKLIEKGYNDTMEKKDEILK